MVAFEILLGGMTLCCPILAHGLKRYHIKNIKYLGKSMVICDRKSSNITNHGLIFTAYGATPILYNQYEHGKWIITSTEDKVEHCVIDYMGNVGNVEHAYVSRDLGADSLENIHNIINNNTLYKYYYTAIILCIINMMFLLL